MNDTVRTVVVVALVIGLGGWGALTVGRKAWPKIKPLYLAHKEIQDTVPDVKVSVHTTNKEIIVTASAFFDVAKDQEHARSVAENIHRLVLKHFPESAAKTTTIHVVSLDSLLRRDPEGTRIYKYPAVDVAQKPPKGHPVLGN